MQVKKEKKQKEGGKKEREKENDVPSEGKCDARC